MCWNLIHNTPRAVVQKCSNNFVFYLFQLALIINFLKTKKVQKQSMSTKSINSQFTLFNVIFFIIVLSTNPLSLAGTFIYLCSLWKRSRRPSLLRYTVLVSPSHPSFFFISSFFVTPDTETLLGKVRLIDFSSTIEIDFDCYTFATQIDSAMCEG